MLDLVRFVYVCLGLRVLSLLGCRFICVIAAHRDVVVDVAAGVGNALNAAHFAFFCGV